MHTSLLGSKGSNGWSCYFGAALVAGAAPKGWMFTKIDSSAGVASTVMKIPTIVDFDESQDPCKLLKNAFPLCNSCNLSGPSSKNQA